MIGKSKVALQELIKHQTFYQTNPELLVVYFRSSCPTNVPNKKTYYFQGNSDIKPETSWNKEIGIEYDKMDFLLLWLTSVMTIVTKIVSDGEFIGLTNLGNYVYKWGNANRAVIEGLKVI